LETNYAVFVHLDAPNGQTFATVDERHPENIPTRNWPPGLYLRNPLLMPIPAGIPPIRYEVRVGMYEPETGQRLAVADNQTSFNLGPLWVTETNPQPAADPVAHFGPHLTLAQPILAGDTLHLTWQTDQPLDPQTTIFIHLLDAEGNLVSQLDGPPYGGLYPLDAWLPNQPIPDLRQLGPPSASFSTIAIGIYNPISGDRLPATDPAGNPLPNNAFILPVSS
jgi:hypothetical protein